MPNSIARNGAANGGVGGRGSNSRAPSARDRPEHRPKTPFRLSVVEANAAPCPQAIPMRFDFTQRERRDGMMNGQGERGGYDKPRWPKGQRGCCLTEGPKPLTPGYQRQ